MLPFTKMLGILPGPHGLNIKIMCILRGLGTKGQGDTDGLKVKGGPAQGNLFLLQVFGDTRVARLNKMGHTKERSLGSTEQRLPALRPHQLRGYSPALGKACEAPCPLPRTLSTARPTLTIVVSLPLLGLP